MSEKTGAARYNAGKPRPSLVPTALIWGCARGMTYGALKYEDHNWRKGFKWTDVLDSLERHLLDFKAGKDIDEESGLHQLDLVACNLGFLMEFVGTGNGVDNRYKLTLDPSATPFPTWAQSADGKWSPKIIVTLGPNSNQVISDYSRVIAG